MITMAEFAAKYNITMKLDRVPYQPGDTMINYTVTLACEDRHLATEFHTGTGWIETLKGEPVHGLHLDLAANKIVPLGRPGLTLYQVEEATRKHRVRTPKVEDVLDSLTSDADSVIGTDYVFDEWCADMGLSNDSIKAKATFDKCVEGVAKLKRFLGDPARFDELLNETERL